MMSWECKEGGREGGGGGADDGILRRPYITLPPLCARIDGLP